MFRATKPPRQRFDDVADPSERAHRLDGEVEALHRHIAEIHTEARHHAKRLKRAAITALDRARQDAAAEGARAQSPATDAVQVALQRVRDAVMAIEYDEDDGEFVDARLKPAPPEKARRG